MGAAAVAPDIDRCKRNNGRHWRCRHPRLLGYKFCEKHLPRRFRSTSVRVFSPESKEKRSSDPPNGSLVDVVVRFSVTPPERREAGNGEARVNVKGEMPGKKRRGRPPNDLALKKSRFVPPMGRRGLAAKDPHLEETGAPGIPAYEPEQSDALSGEGTHLKKIGDGRILAETPKKRSRGGRRFWNTERNRFCNSLRKEWVKITTMLSAPLIAVKQEEIAMEDVMALAQAPAISSVPDPGDSRPLRLITLGDIWALPHDSDRLPRAYVRIEQILPLHDKVLVSLLEFHPISDEEMLWAEEGVPVSCGIFRVSHLKVVREMSALAQLVLAGELAVRLKSFYKIFPKKGEIWAVYRDWDGNEIDPLFHLVEVVTDFTEAAGVTVALLIQMDGSDYGVFKRLSTDIYSKRQLLRFSHRVPGLRVLGRERI